MDSEKIVRELVEHIEAALDVDSDYVDCVRTDLLQYVVALLKEQEEQERKWLQNIADNQLAIGGVDPLTEYEQGKWDGLQMAYEILTEEK